MKTFKKFNEDKYYRELSYRENRTTIKLYSYDEEEENDLHELERDIKKLEENDIDYILLDKKDKFIDSSSFQIMFKIYALIQNKEQRGITYYDMKFIYDNKISIDYNGENKDEMINIIKKNNKDWTIISKDELDIIINTTKFNI